MLSCLALPAAKSAFSLNGQETISSGSELSAAEVCWLATACGKHTNCNKIFCARPKRWLICLFPLNWTSALPVSAEQVNVPRLSASDYITRGRCNRPNIDYGRRINNSYYFFPAYSYRGLFYNPTVTVSWPPLPATLCRSSVAGASGRSARVCWRQYGRDDTVESTAGKTSVF